MSTMILQRDYEGKKAGEKISVPFGKGRDMLKAGIAAYPPQAAPAPTKAVATGKSEIDVLKEAHEAQLAAIRDKHRAEVEKLRADANVANSEAKAALDLADKATAENAELQKKLAELQKPKSGMKETAK